MGYSEDYDRHERNLMFLERCGNDYNLSCDQLEKCLGEGIDNCDRCKEVEE